MRAYFGLDGDPLGESCPRGSLNGFCPVEPLVRQWTLCVVTACVCVCVTAGFPGLEG